MRNQFNFETSPVDFSVDSTRTANNPEYIRRMQRALNRALGVQLPADGVMSFRTRRAIRDFQRRKGLPADGIIGTATAHALMETDNNRPPKAAGESQDESAAFRFFDDGESDFGLDEEVNRKSAAYAKWIQQSLNKIMGLKLAVNGEIRTQTKSAIRSFQKKQGLKDDGIVGATTESALIRQGASPPPQSSGTSPAPSISSNKPAVVTVRDIKPASKLPLILAGPIVRRAAADKVWFWFACSKEIKGCQPHIIPFNPQGKIWTHLADPAFKEIIIDISRSDFRVMRLGENIWIALVSAVPKSGKFPTDITLGYDLDIAVNENGSTKWTKLSKLDLKINYAPFPLPTFVIGKLNRRIVHGSCRRPGAAGEDAFGVYDTALSKSAADAYARPASLILTGDQIYADDVAIPLFEGVVKLASELFGYVEQIPNPNGSGLSRADSYSWKNNGKLPDFSMIGGLINAAKSAKFGEMVKSQIRKVWSGRKQLTNLVSSPIGFTTDDGDAHLLSFPEYAAMYVMVWSPELCRAYVSDKIFDSRSPLWKYGDYVQACRRVMANTATYMLCDDHEITDDWNLDQTWETRTKKNPLARRIIANGLAAYWGFQAWGNDPETFDKNFTQALSLYFEQLRTSKGLPRNVGSRSPYNAAAKYEEQLLEKHWSFMTASNPKALCIDTRTRRETSRDGHGILSGKRAQPYLKNLLTRHGFRKDDILLVVTPTPFLPHRSMMWGQNHEYKFPSQRYEGEYELYGNYPQQRAELIDWLHKNFSPSAVVFFSGDVHHGSVITGRYAYGANLDKVRSGKADWVTRIVQITSSPIKNVNDKFTKTKWWLLGTDKGNAGESIVPRFEHQYAKTPTGDYIAMQAISRSLSGALGRETYIFENHLCVVDMPEKPKGFVKVLYIGVKNGKMETARITVDTDNDPSKFKITKVGAITVTPQDELFELVDARRKSRRGRPVVRMDKQKTGVF
jgi:peptidoglycan hydrolase-like protein with peptidoglycan-binding domain